MVGCELGDDDGCALGAVGAPLGTLLGPDGVALGFALGATVDGADDGCALGADDGSRLGDDDGCSVPTGNTVGIVSIKSHPPPHV